MSEQAKSEYKRVRTMSPNYTPISTVKFDLPSNTTRNETVDQIESVQAKIGRTPQASNKQIPVIEEPCQKMNSEKNLL